MNGKRNVISFMNMKGGVGKTTICVNIAGQLAQMGESVLVIDMDPQMNASQYLLNASQIENLVNSNRTIYNLYKNTVEGNLYSMSGENNEENTEDDSVIINEVRENLSIICGDLNMTKVAEIDGTVSDILKLYIEDKGLKSDYNFIFIDCPPTQSIYTISAFKASDFYLLVIKPDYLSTVGLSLFNNTISVYNKRRTQEERLNGLGIVANLTTKGNDYHDEKIKQITEKFKFNKVFRTCINNMSNIAKASEHQKLMCETKGCKRSIKKLTEEFLGECNARGVGK